MPKPPRAAPGAGASPERLSRLPTAHTRAEAALAQLREVLEVGGGDLRAKVGAVVARLEDKLRQIRHHLDAAAREGERREAVKTWDVLRLRWALDLTQAEFWSRVGCTQSTGSRYEKGRRIPKPVLALILIVHVDGRWSSADDVIHTLAPQAVRAQARMGT